MAQLNTLSENEPIRYMLNIIIGGNWTTNSNKYASLKPGIEIMSRMFHSNSSKITFVVLNLTHKYLFTCLLVYFICFLVNTDVFVQVFVVDALTYFLFTHCRYSLIWSSTYLVIYQDCQAYFYQLYLVQRSGIPAFCFQIKIRPHSFLVVVDYDLLI